MVREIEAFMLILFLCSAFAADFYVDPVQGSSSGDGSATNPWLTLEQVITDGLFTTQGWDALPYIEGQSVLVPTTSGPVGPGDTLWLRTGHHGDAVIQGAYNTSHITIAAEAGHTPTLSHLQVRAGSHWTIRGLTVSPSFGTVYDNQTIVDFDSHSFHGPVLDCDFDGNHVFSVDDISGWSAEDWNALSANAIQVDGDRMTIQNNMVQNINFGVTVNAVNSLVSHNTVENFAGDGLRGLGDYSTFEYNLVRNSYDVNENHDDGFQSWANGPDGVGTGAVTGIELRGNVIVNFEDPNQPLRGPLQGIACFDGFFDDWIIENNVVVVNHWHGISVYGAHNNVIVNNTVIDIEDGEPGGAWIRVNPHKDGTPSSGNLMRNNLANAYVYDTAETDFDHNLEVPFASYGLHFVDFPNDMRLISTSAAIDAGNPAGAPPLDADGATRPAGATIDQGAYEFGAEIPGTGTTDTGDVLTDTFSTPTGEGNPPDDSKGCGCTSTGVGGAFWLWWLPFFALRRSRCCTRATATKPPCSTRWTSTSSNSTP